MLARILAGFHKFLNLLFGRVAEDEAKIVEVWLSAEETRLFREMPKFDQRHSLDTFYAAQRIADREKDSLSAGERTVLLRAALLHDSAKWQGSPTLIHRAIFGLLEASLGENYAAVRRSSFLQAIVEAHLTHGKRSTEAILKINPEAEPLLMEIITDHAAPKSTRDHTLLCLLREADSESLRRKRQPRHPGHP